jgi:hypothetical protein
LFSSIPESGVALDEGGKVGVPESRIQVLILLDRRQCPRISFAALYSWSESFFGTFVVIPLAVSVYHLK